MKIKQRQNENRRSNIKCQLKRTKQRQNENRRRNRNCYIARFENRNKRQNENDNLETLNEVLSLTFTGNDNKSNI